MNAQKVLDTLRQHQAEIEAFGVVHRRLFGSVARGKQVAGSDVDLLADFDASQRLTLVKLGSLQARLATIVGTNVDVCSADWMLEAVRMQAESEAKLAF